MVSKFCAGMIGFKLGNSTGFVRPVESSDIEDLRVWKNRYRDSFHFKEVISPDQQAAWYSKFSQDQNSQIFVLLVDGVRVGCVGFRKRSQNVVELFNLICGVDAFLGKGYISSFFKSCAKELSDLGYRTVFLEVLKSNQLGLTWYRRQGFTQVQEHSDFFVLSLDLTDLFTHAVGGKPQDVTATKSI